MNRLQILCVWLAGACAIALCLYPPWVVGWTMLGDHHRTIHHAPLWWEPAEIVRDDSKPVFVRAVANWKKANDEGARAHAEWERRKRRWEDSRSTPDAPTSVAPPADDVFSRGRRNYQAIFDRIDALEAAKAANTFPEPEPKTWFQYPVVKPMRVSTIDADCACIAWSRFALEFTVILIAGGLHFVSLGRRRRRESTS